MQVPQNQKKTKEITARDPDARAFKDQKKRTQERLARIDIKPLKDQI